MAAQGPSPSVQIQQVIDELSPVFALEVGIHAHTRTIGLKCQTLRHFEQDFKLTHNAPTLDAVIEDIKLYADNDPNVNIVLATIKAQGAAIEDETLLNIPTMLISTWTLAKTSQYSNAQDCVIENLKHNKATGGGCPAGISARLVLPYLHFLKSAVDGKLGYLPPSNTSDEASQLQAAIEASKQPLAAPATEFDEDSQLQAAIEASKQQLAPQANEALELALAMALSQEAALRFTSAAVSAAPGIEEDDELAAVLYASRFDR